MADDAIDLEELFDDAGVDLESLTLVLVRGGSEDEVIRVLGADPVSNGEPFPDLDDEDYSGYAVAAVEGGVIAFEHTGYADPSPRVLAELSGLGGAAAVARSNIQAHVRFGCARDGQLVFDADEFMYVSEEEKDAVPSELRDLFDAAWVDLEADEDAEESEGLVEVVMAATYTGVAFTSQDLQRATAQGYHRVRSLTYLE